MPSTLLPAPARFRRRRATAALAVAAVLLAGSAACRRPGGNPPPTPPTTTTTVETTTTTTTAPSSGGGEVTRETDPGIERRTIYRPADLTGARLPVIVWGQGGCFLAGDTYDVFQRSIAASGYLIIANNVPGVQAGTTADMLRESITWAIAENSRAGSKYEGKLDTTKVAAMGQSCGGLEALSIGDDPRLTTVVAWNSGVFPDGGLGGATKADVDELHTPTMWVNGGESDIAYPQALDDFARSKVPSVWANLEVGHMNGFVEPGVREFSRIGLTWLDWHLKGKPENQAQLVGGSCGMCGSNGWLIQSKNWG